MALYHFNIDNSLGYVGDHEGRELPDLETARREALKGIRSLIAEEVMNGCVDLDGRLEVTDEQGTILFAIGYAEAVEIHPPAGSEPRAKSPPGGQASPN